MDAEAARLEWRSGAVGCIGLIALFGTFWMLYLAVWPGSLTVADTHLYRGWILALAAKLTAGRVGWGFLALAAVFAWLTLVLLWRFSALTAATATPAGLRLHGPFGATTSWSEVKRISLPPVPRGVAVDVLYHRPQPGPFNPLRRCDHRLMGVADDRGEAGAFVADAERMRQAATDGG